MRDRQRGAARRGWLLVFVGGLLVVGFAVYAAEVSQQGQGAAARSRSSQPSEADQKINVRGLDAKLDEILAAQENTLARFDDLLEDLRIVKVRVSR